MNRTSALFAVMLALMITSLPYSDADDAEVVVQDFFDAMDDGRIAVRFIPQDAARANVLIENLTEHFVHIELPDAIAAVPVMAQFGQDPLGLIGQGAGGQQGGGNQAVSGAMPGGQANGFGNAQGNGFGQGNAMGRNAGGQGNGMGFMRIAPGKIRKVSAVTFCVEHGKPEPNPRIPYQIVRLSEVTEDAEILELCQRLGNGQINQKIAQAVAWHVVNGLSWEQLAAVNRIESRYIGNIRMFNKHELNEAKQFVSSAAKLTSYQK